MRLSELPRGAAAVVAAAESTPPVDSIAKRLGDLGSVKGEAARAGALPEGE